MSFGRLPALPNADSAPRRPALSHEAAPQPATDRPRPRPEFWRPTSAAPISAEAPPPLPQQPPLNCLRRHVLRSDTPKDHPRHPDRHSGQRPPPRAPGDAPLSVRSLLNGAHQASCARTCTRTWPRRRIVASGDAGEERSRSKYPVLKLARFGDLPTRAPACRNPSRV